MKRITLFSTLTILFLFCIYIWQLFLILELNNFFLLILTIGVVFFIGAIYYSLQFIKYEKIIYQIESSPILETDEAVEDIPFSAYGIIESDQVLKSPYKKVDCVYYHSIKEVKVSKRTWIVKENKVGFVPFYLKDKRGKIKIDPSVIDKDFSGFRLKIIPKFVFFNNDNSEIDGELILNKKNIRN